MISAGDIYQAVDAVAPFDSALEYDNVGILVGGSAQQVSRVMLCLDITPDIIEEAAGKNVDLLLSHHPVIFSPLKALSDRDVPYLLAQRGIAALCCHTNLDMAAEIGVNISLAKKLGLVNIRGGLEAIQGYYTYCGELPEAAEPAELAMLVKHRLNAGRILFKAGEKPVKKICVCSGAGGEYLEAAEDSGADAFITGELKHHEMLEAIRLSITVIAAGHYETETCFGDLLMPYLEREFPSVGFIHSKKEEPPMKYI